MKIIKTKETSYLDQIDEYSSPNIGLVSSFIYNSTAWIFCKDVFNKTKKVCLITDYIIQI